MVIRGRQVSDHRELCISEGLCDYDMKYRLEEPELFSRKMVRRLSEEPRKGTRTLTRAVEEARSNA